MPLLWAIKLRNKFCKRIRYSNGLLKFIFSGLLLYCLSLQTPGLEAGVMYMNAMRLGDTKLSPPSSVLLKNHSVAGRRRSHPGRTGERRPGRHLWKKLTLIVWKSATGALRSRLYFRLSAVRFLTTQNTKTTSTQGRHREVSSGGWV